MPMGVASRGADAGSHLEVLGVEFVEGIAVVDEGGDADELGERAFELEADDGQVLAADHETFLVLRSQGLEGEAAKAAVATGVVPQRSGQELEVPDPGEAELKAAEKAPGLGKAPDLTSQEVDLDQARVAGDGVGSELVAGVQGPAGRRHHLIARLGATEGPLDEKKRRAPRLAAGDEVLVQVAQGAGSAPPIPAPLVHDRVGDVLLLVGLRRLVEGIDSDRILAIETPAVRDRVRRGEEGAIDAGGELGAEGVARQVEPAPLVEPLEAQSGIRTGGDADLEEVAGHGRDADPQGHPEVLVGFFDPRQDLGAQEIGAVHEVLRKPIQGPFRVGVAFLDVDEALEERNRKLRSLEGHGTEEMGGADVPAEMNLGGAELSVHQDTVLEELSPETARVGQCGLDASLSVLIGTVVENLALRQPLQASDSLVDLGGKVGVLEDDLDRGDACRGAGIDPQNLFLRFRIFENLAAAVVVAEGFERPANLLGETFLQPGPAMGVGEVFGRGLEETDEGLDIGQHGPLHALDDPLGLLFAGGGDGGGAQPHQCDEQRTRERHAIRSPASRRDRSHRRQAILTLATRTWTEEV